MTMDQDIRIEVEDLSVSFPLYHGSGRSLKKMVFAAASGRLAKDTQHRIVVQALRHINLSLRSGDRLGLVGSNGAGKTTLLRVLAGIYEPVAGKLLVNGSVSALLDTNLGMNIDLTGRENIRLRGLYNGVPKAVLEELEADPHLLGRHGDPAGVCPGDRDSSPDPADGRMVPGRRRGVPGKGPPAAGGDGAAVGNLGTLQPPVGNHAHLV